MLALRFRSVISLSKSVTLPGRVTVFRPTLFKSFQSTSFVRVDYSDDEEEGDFRALTPTIVNNSINSKKSDTDASSEAVKQTIFDTEREMFQIRRKMTAAYSLGEYKMALEYAEDLLVKAEDIMGKRNAVYASCLNNVALMLKALGQQEKAMDKYVAALHVYYDIAGQNNTSYASALANIGVLYKEMSKGRMVKKDELDEHDEGVFVPVTGLEKMALLDRSEEALVEARDTRIKLLGLEHKDSLYSSMHLASLLRMQNKPDQALAMLLEALTAAEEKYTKMDLVCASLHNDLGVLHKSEKRYAEAKTHYTQALHIRSNILGDTHNDTVVCTYNLAELYSAMGEPESANKLHEEVMKTLEQRNQRSGGSRNSSNGKDGKTEQESVVVEHTVSSGSGGTTSTNTTSTSTSASGSKILEYTHKPTSTSTTTTNSPAAPTVTSSSSTFTEERPDIAKIVAKQQQTYKDSAEGSQDTEEERKRKFLALTMATRPHKPATRRAPKKA